jgi:hypothetical protein
MELNEVKIGDTVSFTHKGKTVTGKVIHRHDGNKNAALAGHINIQPMDADSSPHTIHVSKIRPGTQIKEDIHMSDINEAILDLIDNIDAGNHVEANSIFSSLLQHKIDELLDAKKAEVSSSMFNTEECAECMEEEKKMKKDDEDEDEDEDDEEEIDEALKGNQHKIDANKNGKVDAHDFKLLRKKKGVKEEAEYVDEGNAENKKKKNLAISPFGQTSGTNMKQARADHAASEPKDPYVHPDRSKMGTTALKNAIKRVRRPASYRYKPTLPEEVEQVDEISQKTKDSYVAKRGSQLSSMMYGPSKNDNLLSGKRQAKAVKGIKQALNKEEVAHEAYSDPYAAKKSAEMKKAHAATMADAKKEYDAARKPKFAKNFMKMKKEDVELEEGNAENKMKKNAYADAKGAANKNGALDRGSQRRVDSQRKDEVDSIKKGIDNYAPKKAAVRNIIRGKVFGKLSDTETKMFARKRVKEDVNLQELDADTLRSYISKRAKPGQLDAARKGDSTAKKQVKGISNANASLTKKYKSKMGDSYNNAAAASYNKAKPGTYHGD